jgi:hypothetical protein
MTFAMRRPFVRKPIFSQDVQQLGGVVSVAAGRDRVEGEPRYHVVHRSRGGDCCWRSHGIESEDEALAGARLLAVFVGADLVT